MVQPLRAAATALLLVAGASALAQQAVALVNGVPISLETLDRRFDDYLRARNMNIQRLQRPEKVREMKREVLDGLIAEELLWQHARSQGRVATDEDVESALVQARAQYRSSEQFQRSLARQGHTEASYRDHVRRMLSADKAAQSLVERSVDVTQAEIEAFYTANVHAFARPEQVRLREIALLIPAAASAQERADVRTRMQAIVTQLAAGADFSDLARRYSQHPTRQWGGAHDLVARGQLPGELEQAAFALRPGQTSGIIETSQGLHLLRVDERLPASTMGLEAARARIREHLVATRGREVLEREVAALRARNRVEVLVPL
jgi:parvulin-like peptidyl-prolyl isomerase